MELITAVLLAGPLGYFARSRLLGQMLYLAAWAIVFPIQTAQVYLGDGAHGHDWTYFPVNAVILALGIGLNQLGARMRERRLRPV